MERKEAGNLGYLKYSTGRPCKHGHIAPRYVDSGACSLCLKSMATRGAGLRKWIADNTVKVRLFSKLSGLPGIKTVVDTMNAARLPTVAPEAVNPEPYRKKLVSRETYHIELRVHPDDVAALLEIGKVLLEPEIEL